MVDVLADADGRVRIAIIDFGGFLGVGTHRIGVEWSLLHFNPDSRDSSLVLSLSREQLRVAPEYKDNPRPQILTEPTSAAPGAPASPASPGTSSGSPSTAPAPAPTPPSAAPSPAAQSRPPAESKK